jgi:hypothetical protein
MMTHTTKASLRRAMKAAKKEGLRIRRSVAALSDSTPLTLAEVADRLRGAQRAASVRAPQNQYPPAKSPDFSRYRASICGPP